MTHLCATSLHCKHICHFLGTPLNLIKLIQISFILIDLIATESVFLFLNSIEVDWRTGGFLSFDLQRVILCLSLLTTASSLGVSWWRRRQDEGERRCKSCGGAERRMARSKTTADKCDWDFADYIHSLLSASSFIVCAVCMIAYVPDDYQHPVEVGIKVLSFLLDLILCLLFTKSCMTSYFQYYGGSGDLCDCEARVVAIYDSSSASSSGAGYSDETTADEGAARISLVAKKSKRKNGKTYTMLDNETS